MLTKREILSLAISLVRMNDSQVVQADGALTSEVCIRSERAQILQVVTLIQQLRQAFSYTNTPEYERLIVGKTPAYSSMRAALEDQPTKKAQHLCRFDDALEALLESDLAFDLAPLSEHEKLNTLRALCAGLANPVETSSS